ncbi:hypothetical protein TARUN_4026 [Trichoderma arundinaceum]|uniref:Uncharacterized protein n=1 Tax=Trichoderma arundinaceum TaxID=490622 RepID=A0A395NQB9_TRIAR|nr:hypothetical protein TARUN_4026 [Trichoderma arundinaceum]
MPSAALIASHNFASASSSDSDVPSSSSASSSSRPRMDSNPRPIASVLVLRCMRCARSAETTTTDDASTAGMVRISHNLYYCQTLSAFESRLGPLEQRPSPRIYPDHQTGAAWMALSRDGRRPASRFPETQQPINHMGREICSRAQPMDAFVLYFRALEPCFPLAILEGGWSDGDENCEAKPAGAHRAHRTVHFAVSSEMHLRLVSAHMRCYPNVAPSERYCYYSRAFLCVHLMHTQGAGPCFAPAVSPVSLLRLALACIALRCTSNQWRALATSPADRASNWRLRHFGTSCRRWPLGDDDSTAPGHFVTGRLSRRWAAYLSGELGTAIPRPLWLGEMEVPSPQPRVHANKRL